MVLIIDGKPLASVFDSISDFYKTFPIYGKSAKKFLSIGKRDVGPRGLLYVLQREFAATTADDNNVDIIGSDDATTCIIVIVKHSTSQATALAHFDGLGQYKNLLSLLFVYFIADIEEIVPKMIERVMELSQHSEDGIELQLVGGYSDEQNYSEDIFYNIIRVFHLQPVNVFLTLACVGDLNTIVKDRIPWPIIYGVGVDLKTGSIFIPCEFTTYYF